MSAGVMELPRISIKTDVKRAEARPFVGRVVTDALQPGKFEVEKKPYQWTIAVQPLKSVDGTKGFQIGGKTGAFWEYIGVPKEALEGDIKEQDKFGRHFNAFKKTFNDGEDRAIGRGEYVDLVAWFIKDRVEYGTDKQTGAQITSGVLLPQRRLTDEEMVEYGLVAPGAAPSANVGYPDEELSTLADLLNGIDRNALYKKAYATRGLANALRQGVGSRGDGPAIQAMVERGIASFDGDILRAA